MLKQRIITASMMASLTLWWILALDSDTLAVIFAVVFGVGAWEWSRLVGLHSPLARGAYTAAFPVMYLLIHPLLDPDKGTWPQFILVLSLIWWTMALMSVLTYPRSAALWQNSAVARALAGVMVLVPSWAALVLLHSGFEHGYFILMAFI